MQNYNQTESTNYQTSYHANHQNQNLNQQQQQISSIDNNVSNHDLSNNLIDDSMALPLIDSASYQSDSNSAFFNNTSTSLNSTINAVDCNNMQTSFLPNDKSSNNGNNNNNNSYVTNQNDELSQTSLTSTCSSQFDDSNRSIKMNNNSIKQQQQQQQQLQQQQQQQITNQHQHTKNAIEDESQSPPSYQAPIIQKQKSFSPGASRSKVNLFNLISIIFQREIF